MRVCGRGSWKCARVVHNRLTLAPQCSSGAGMKVLPTSTKCKQTIRLAICERPSMAPPRSTRLHFLDAHFWLLQPSAPWKQGSVQRREHSLLPATQGEIHPKTQPPSLQV